MVVTHSRRTRVAPWAALVAALLAEGLHHQVLSDMLRFDCRLGTPAAGLLGATAAACLLAIGVGVSWWAVRARGADDPASRNRRFIAHLGWLMCALVAVGVSWQTFAMMVVPPCR